MVSREWHFSIDELPSVVKNWRALTGDTRVIALHGPMGAGKTTFVSALCRTMGVQDPVTSPTFSLINEYRLPGGGAFYHIDLYRIRDEEEAEQAGIGECLYSGDYCVVEWPEKAPGIFPPGTLHAWIEPTGPDTRRLKLEYPVGNA
ncbi:MAG: tRNA (adenosine(37)-N6)-threonylcarbamoyltransferase complex ATPase subunit type 1 TsaE [Chitinophagaceae bacterium]|jgi:tRNA threonylcarbamoyladenosine biosynthesis protein TsaE|nr:tRNA (adenosine(37)-N6)-threonylcarbamoyltransferase complex ATPase subunit type 1 TsaE [Chitinophagaceae bacterium]